MRRASDESDRGMVSMELVIGFTIFLAVMLTALNLAVMQYARGAARAAAEEGARAGAVNGQGVEECQAIALSTLDGLLGGSYGGDLVVQCIDLDDSMVAIVAGPLEPWVAPMPDVTVDVRIAVAKEPEL